MKVRLNVTTSYEGRSLKLGDEVDIPLNIAQRWINNGIAHVVKEEVRPVEKPIIKPVIEATEPSNIYKPFVEKTIEKILSPQHEILPTITRKNIKKLKTSNPKKYNK
jgi:hypothetical protein